MSLSYACCALTVFSRLNWFPSWNALAMHCSAMFLGVFLMGFINIVRICPVFSDDPWTCFLCICCGNLYYMLCEAIYPIQDAYRMHIFWVLSLYSTRLYLACWGRKRNNCCDRDISNNFFTNKFNRFSKSVCITIKQDPKSTSFYSK